MSDFNPDPTLSTTKARSQLAVSYMGGEPDAATKRLLKANLACANIDNKIRDQLRGVELFPTHVGHLVGLLLSSVHIDGATVTVIEKLTRDAAEAAEQTRAGDA